jgi:small subunit ribosomal protein S21
MADNAVVTLHYDMSLERALARLKKLLALNGTYADLKRRAHYVKPGERKRLKSKRARVKLRKAQRRKEASEPRDD